jgi:hypothetical protein
VKIIAKYILKNNNTRGYHVLTETRDNQCVYHTCWRFHDSFVKRPMKVWRKSFSLRERVG